MSNPVHVAPGEWSHLIDSLRYRLNGPQRWHAHRGRFEELEAVLERWKEEDAAEEARLHSERERISGIQARLMTEGKISGEELRKRLHTLSSEPESNWNWETS